MSKFFFLLKELKYGLLYIAIVLTITVLTLETIPSIPGPVISPGDLDPIVDILGDCGNLALYIIYFMLMKYLYDFFKNYYGVTICIAFNWVFWFENGVIRYGWVIYDLNNKNGFLLSLLYYFDSNITRRFAVVPDRSGMYALHVVLLLQNSVSVSPAVPINLPPVLYPFYAYPVPFSSFVGIAPTPADQARIASHRKWVLCVPWFNRIIWFCLRDIYGVSILTSNENGEYSPVSLMAPNLTYIFIGGLNGNFNPGLMFQ